jgi:hypothetical protein
LGCWVLKRLGVFEYANGEKIVKKEKFVHGHAILAMYISW